MQSQNTSTRLTNLIITVDITLFFNYLEERNIDYINTPLYTIHDIIPPIDGCISQNGLMQVVYGVDLPYITYTFETATNHDELIATKTTEIIKTFKRNYVVGVEWIKRE